MTWTAGRILDLEARAFAAWPAAEVALVGGWPARFMSGVSRRANSVWTLRDEGGGDLDARVAAVERFYRERGARPTFHVIPGSSLPPGLDEALAARGWVVDAPVAVEVAPAEAVARPHEDGAAVTVSPALGEAWFDVSGRQGRFAAVQDTYRGLLGRLAGRALFALASVEGRPAAVALGVIDGAWMGVFSMATLPAYRRRGLASAALRALAAAGRERGARDLYLQVERDNAPARALYERHGFREAYAYHYRVAPAVTSAAT